MPLHDVIEIVERLSALSNNTLFVYLYKDVIECSYFPDFVRFLQKRNLLDSLEPLPTHGWPRDAAQTPHWLDALASAGVKSLWLTIHGFAEEHDRFVRRPGAYFQILKFARAAVAKGLCVVWNLALRGSNFDALRILTQSAELRAISEQMRFSVSAHLGNAKRIYGDRPHIGQVREFEASGLVAATPLFSEAEWLSRIDLDIFATKPMTGGYAEVRVMPDFSIWLHDFPADRYIGNLRLHSFDRISCALFDKPSFVGDLKKATVQPRVAKLARICGNSFSDSAHCEYSIVSTWLERLSNSHSQVGDVGG